MSRSCFLWFTLSSLLPPIPLSCSHSCCPRGFKITRGCSHAQRPREKHEHTLSSFLQNTLNPLYQAYFCLFHLFFSFPVFTFSVFLYVLFCLYFYIVWLSPPLMTYLLPLLLIKKKQQLPLVLISITLCH